MIIWMVSAGVEEGREGRREMNGTSMGERRHDC